MEPTPGAPAGDRPSRATEPVALVGPAESGLVVPVHEATPAVAQWRARLDPAAAHGVPAHVTVLYPFVTPESLDDAHVGRLTALFDDVAAFDFVLRRIGWFADTVVYLAPEPAAPFVALTERVMQEFPGHAPYAGAFDEITPHLTIGDRGSAAELQVAADAVAPALPIRARASEVWLMMGSATARTWRVHTRFALGGAA